MATLRKFPRFLASTFAAPKAMLSRLKWTVDRHSDFIEAIEGADGIRVRRNYKGGVTISGGSGGDGESPAEYTSYFKVYDASSGGNCMIGVRDGSTVSPMSNHCGGVWINGDYSATENAVTAALTEECTIFVWLLSRIVMDGVASSIGFTTTSNAPPPGGLVGSSRLLGRASIVSDGDGGYIVLAINQDYLSGGEHIAILYADCGLFTVGN